jgi:dihydroorotate dehydrogenase electron transfer subunit
VGAPPLYFFAQRLCAADSADCKILVVNGARSRDLLVGVEEFDQLDVDVTYTTDDGSHGRQGIVTDVLEELLTSASGPVHVYTCGPTVMMRAVAEVCTSHGSPCQVSLETLMPCGLGVCMGCVVKIKDDSSPGGFQYLRSCYEGPVFPADRIIWE